MNSNGDIFNEIARTVHSNTTKIINGAMDGTGLTLGTLTEYGLKLDNFKYEFTDYMILDYLKLEDNYNTETNGDHLHEIKTPSNIKKLTAGDRVLVAQFGADNIIIGRVVKNG
ncbi:hypothetical protein [Clostridium saccharobutylicum]|uniref:Uncharacterized protein n=1 Tax=Clostridium saccharobutylicum DSM 13864 TaxID=1345695 RepID=U5MUQ4_CLOSA|nr:hypothetical protein CLSA_c35430 [Clostridium saccharobutylicum DSM 13864]AQR91798.1 hypothetical protein CLOSC_35260 [Clostridium saccharobutylicum]AQS01700.1 hypothetical protein CSACC_35310 [Clostridium saccharobutylicum]AQS11306.1 hypothetical protein CLOBY_34620 [Clostridium saccharobutylicum]AQS15683.1 hypothetical protein CLOSACC_35310 [Clostridium saccharobutylicum]